MSVGVIDISQMEKRKKALSTVSESTDYLLEVANNSIERNLSTKGSDICKAIRNCSPANMNYDAYLGIIENADEFTNEAVSTLITDIVPGIDNLSSFIESVNNSNLSDENKEKIISVAEMYDVCDRVYRNHNNISKRFNISRYMKENSFIPINILVSEICSMIDTFKSPAPTKMNTCIEECSYLFQKEGKSYSRQNLVECILDYFLCREQKANVVDFKNYAKVLTENKFISKDDLSPITYFLKEYGEEETNYPENVDVDLAVDSIYKENNMTIHQLLDLFKLSEDKTAEKFTEFIGVIKRLSVVKIVSSASILINWMYNYALNQLYGKNVIINAWNSIVATIIDKCATRIECEKFLEEIDKSLSIISSAYNYMDNDDLSSFVNALRQSVVDINKYMDTLNDDKVYISNDNVENYSLAEYVTTPVFNTLFWRNKLIKESLTNNNNATVNSIMKLATPIMISEREIVFTENVLEFLTENGTFDHTVAIFDVHNNDDIPAVKGLLKEFCASINKLNSANATCFAYIESVESIVELHLCDSNIVNLTEAQLEDRNNILTEADLTYIGMLNNINEIVDRLDNIDTKQLKDTFAEVENSLSADNICDIIELSEYMNGLIGYDRINEIARTYRENNPDDYLGNSKISHVVEKWQLRTVDMDIVSEAAEALNEALLTEKIDFKPGQNQGKGKEDSSDGKNSSDKPNKMGDKGKVVSKDTKKDSEEDNDEVKEDKSKKKDKKFNLNTLKFLMIDLSAKAKKLDTKSKQISKEVDMAANQFVKAVKDLYRNDNRESIIRGSVIPSFHKLYQRAIVGVIGTGVIALFNPTTALISAALYVLSLIAVSKHSTEKERALLLDEIDIELDVVEKELANAESRNQIKRYRTLLVHKKKLQRERSRIKYRIKFNGMVVRDLADREEDS